MVKSPSTARVTVSTNPSLVVIPAGVYLDAIEYQGESSFRASQAFKIGLGQLNNTISTPLIEGGTTQIANERGGGGRLLSGNSVNGANKIYTTAPTYINFVSEGDIQAGHLRVDLYYHTKG